MRKTNHRDMYFGFGGCGGMVMLWPNHQAKRVAPAYRMENHEQ